MAEALGRLLQIVVQPLVVDQLAENALTVIDFARYAFEVADDILDVVLVRLDNIAEPAQNPLLVAVETVYHLIDTGQFARLDLRVGRQLLAPRRPERETEKHAAEKIGPPDLRHRVRRNLLLPVDVEINADLVVGQHDVCDLADLDPRHSHGIALVDADDRIEIGLVMVLILEGVPVLDQLDQTAERNQGQQEEKSHLLLYGHGHDVILPCLCLWSS